MRIRNYLRDCYTGPSARHENCEIGYRVTDADRYGEQGKDCRFPDS